MATEKKQGAKAPRPSGPTQTKAQRRASGKTRIDVWIHDDSAELLEAMALQIGCTKAVLIEDAILLLSETAAGFGVDKAKAMTYMAARRKPSSSHGGTDKGQR